MLLRDLVTVLAALASQPTAPVPVTMEGHTGPVLCVAWSPDGKRLASAGMDGSIRLWDPGSGRELEVRQGHKKPVNDLTFGADGRLVSGCDQGTVRVDDDKRAADIYHTPLRARSVCWGPAGKLVACASGDCIYLLDSHTGKEVRTLRPNTYMVQSVAFHPGGKHVAGSSGELFQRAEVRVWEVATGNLTLAFKGHASWITRLRYSPDGGAIATASYDHTVRLWDACNGRERLVLRGHTNVVTDVDFSPDGRWLATSSDDGTLRLWDAKSGAPVATLRGGGGLFNAVRFHPDGSRLATADQRNRLAQVWDVRRILKK